MSVSTYLRPGQMLSLSSASLVPPVPGVTKYWSLLVHPEEGPSRSKTGEADVSIILDSAWCSFMEP
eukprot:10026947-Lingulodinium_polyedra.AAC.1